DWRPGADKAWRSPAADRSSAATRILIPDKPPRAFPRNLRNADESGTSSARQPDDRTEECQARMAVLRRRLFSYAADAARPEEPVAPSCETTRDRRVLPTRTSADIESHPPTVHEAHQHHAVQ